MARVTAKQFVSRFTGLEQYDPTDFFLPGVSIPTTLESGLEKRLRARTESVLSEVLDGEFYTISFYGAWGDRKQGPPVSRPVGLMVGFDPNDLFYAWNRGFTHKPNLPEFAQNHKGKLLSKEYLLINSVLSDSAKIIRPNEGAVRSGSTRILGIYTAGNGTNLRNAEIIQETLGESGIDVNIHNLPYGQVTYGDKKNFSHSYREFMLA